MASYKQDPNNDRVQIPNTDFGEEGRFNKVIIPAPNVIQERPNQVIINNAGIVSFLYDTTGSSDNAGLVATNHGTNAVNKYITGSILSGDGGPITLDIQPIAWNNSVNGGTVGDVTFVYKGVK